MLLLLKQMVFFGDIHERKNPIIIIHKREWWKEENSTGEWGTPTSHVSCKQTCYLAGAAAHNQQAGVGKLEKVAVGGKLQRRGWKTHFPHEL
jgi:hypothetical protein